MASHFFLLSESCKTEHLRALDAVHQNNRIKQHLRLDNHGRLDIQSLGSAYRIKLPNQIKVLTHEDQVD